jgi:hypothetical protein
MTVATEIIGPIQDRGADIVPLPLTEQVREYIRASKAESTVAATIPIGNTSAVGPRRTSFAHYPRVLRRSHPILPSVPGT